MDVNSVFNSKVFDPMDLDQANGQILDVDVICSIFKDLKADFPNIALVCKNWKVIVDEKVIVNDKNFLKMISPQQVFGANEWKEYIGVDAGVEPRLPRWVYGYMETGNYMLTFIPKVVKIIKENHGIDEVKLDNLIKIGKLLANPIKGNKTNFTENSWQIALKETRKLEEPHWVLISKDGQGRNMKYSEQLECAKKMQMNVSGLIDTVISVWCEYVKSGKRYFDLSDTWVRVNERTGGVRLGSGFASSGLYVYFNFDGFAHFNIVFSSSRKSFGT